MASNPPGACCTKGFTHDGTPKGSILSLGEVESYVVHPASGPSKSVVYIMTDVFGHRFINLQLYADNFAKEGHTVVMPDLFNGDAVPPPGAPRPEGFEIMEWLKGHMPEQVDPIVTKVLAALKTEYQPEKLFTIGLCFGGKYVAHLLATDDFTAGFMAHPSFVSIDELSRVRKPLSIAAAETDTIFTTALRHESEAQLQKMKATYVMTVYSGVEHGFAVRGDVSEKWVKWAKEAAFRQAVEWFAAFA
ncbi:Alpha/Beta hydrolase protein [Geopyxis carbonaria]|nr:Alpha/Beta hydrolase protein [Geopyxis carbonaria]